MSLNRRLALLAGVMSLVGVSPFSPRLASARTDQQVGVEQREAAKSPGLSGKVLRQRRRNTVDKVLLRLRNFDSNAVVGQTTSAEDGAYSFLVPEPGLYVVEAIDDDGRVRAVGTPTHVTTSELSADVIWPAPEVSFHDGSLLRVTAAAFGAGIVAHTIEGRPPMSPER